MAPSIYATLAPNRRGIINLQSAWRTDVSPSALTLSEDRRGLWGRPTRAMRALLTGVDQRRAAALLFATARRADQVSHVPLYCDETEVGAGSTDTSIAVDTTKRRFYAGFKAFLLRIQDGLVVKETLIDMDSVSPSEILPGVVLDEAPKQGDIIVPALHVDITLQAQIRWITEYIAETDFSAVEVIGPTSLPPSEETYPPPGFQTYKGRPILPIDHDWKSDITTKIIRGGSQYASGRAQITETAGRRPQIGYGLSFLTPNRDAFWNHLRFADSIRGRRRSFVVIPPQTLFEPVALTTTYLEVVPLVATEDLEFLMDLVGLEMYDGTLLVREVASTTVSGIYWRITFDEAIPGGYSLGSIARATSAHIVRSARDYLEEVWHTDQSAILNYEVAELLDDKSVEIDNIYEPDVLGVPDSFPDLQFWFSAHTNCYWSKAKPNNPANLKLDKLTTPDSKYEFVSAVCDVRKKASFKFSDPYLMALGANEPPHIHQMGKGTAAGRRAFNAVKQNVFTQFNRFYFGSNLDYYYGDFWSVLNGMTLFAVWQLKEDETDDCRFLWKEDVFEWDSDAVRIYETEGVITPTQWLPIPTTYRDGAIHIYTVHWQPGVSSKLYIDGKLVVTAGAPVNSIPSNGQKAEVIISDSTGAGSPEKNHKLFEMFGYQRAMAAVDMNSIGEYLAQVYSIVWTTIP